MIKYAKRFLPFESLKNLYTGLVDPHFRYCCAVWGVCGFTEIQQLQKLQNRAARIITGSNYDAPSKPLIKGLGWKTIEDFTQYESQLIVFISKNGLAPQYLFNTSVPQYLSTSVPQYLSTSVPQFAVNSADSRYYLGNTATDLRLPKKNSSNWQKGFSYKGTRMWNSLRTESKLAPSLASFKKFLMHDAWNVQNNFAYYYRFYFYHGIFNKIIFNIVYNCFIALCRNCN